MESRALACFAAAMPNVAPPARRVASRSVAQPPRRCAGPSIALAPPRLALPSPGGAVHCRCLQRSTVASPLHRLQPPRLTAAEARVDVPSLAGALAAVRCIAPAFHSLPAQSLGAEKRTSPLPTHGLDAPLHAQPQRRPAWPCRAVASPSEAWPRRASAWPRATLRGRRRWFLQRSTVASLGPSSWRHPSPSRSSASRRGAWPPPCWA